VLGAIIRRFAIRQRQINTEFAALMEQVRQRCVLSGKAVQLTTPSGPRVGVVDSLSPAGELILRGPNGRENLIQADEIRILSQSTQNPVSPTLNEAPMP
jgi:biotin-(acetyl-CoA carboxylase) ligase